MIPMLLIIMFGLLLFNFPMVMPMVMAPLAVMLTQFPNVNPVIAIQQLVAGVQPFVLLAVPMFIFAADIMSVGQTSKRLLDFVQTFVGHIHGGLATTTAATCTLFGAISGSTQATVVAIGKLMRGEMKEAGYDDSKSIGLIISASIIALLIPPSISMIMYSVASGASVGDMFIAGIAPGLLILAAFAIYNYFSAKKHNIPRKAKVTWEQRGKAFKDALAPLGFPVIIFVGIYSGFFSPTEAAAVSVLYALILELFLFKTITFKDIPKIALSSAVVTATVFILVAAGQLFSWVISYAKIPQVLSATLLGADPSALQVLIMTSIFFFIACMFVDSLVAIVILTPIFYPIATAVGIHPIHLGIIVTLQAAIGSVSPPVGCNIFTASAVFDKPYLKIVKGLPPYMIILGLVSLIVILFPQLSLFLIS